MEIASTSPLMATRPGKSAQSVGHMAKAAVSEAKAAGLDLPKNAQGFAASAIARGADASTVFAALVVPDPVTTQEGPVADADAGVADPDAAEPTAEAGAMAQDGYAAASDVLGTGVIAPEEIALALLDEMA